MTLSFKSSPFAPRHLPQRRTKAAWPEWSQIRRYHPADLTACLAVWAKASRRAHPFLRLAPWLRQGMRLWRGQLEQAKTWVYVHQGEVRGFLSVHPQHQIAGLFVDPACQGQGIGSQLLDKVSEMVGLDSVTVYALNQRARRFYEQHGFRVFDVSPTDADGERYALLRMVR